LYGDAAGGIVRRADALRVRETYIATMATTKPADARYVLNRNSTGTRRKSSRYMAPPALGV
jgi:hypothetical protein